MKYKEKNKKKSQQKDAKDQSESDKLNAWLLMSSREKCPLGCGEVTFVSPKAQKCIIMNWGYKHGKSGSQGLVLTFAGNYIQQHTLQHQPLVKESALTTVSSWHHQMLSSCKDQCMEPVFVRQLTQTRTFQRTNILFGCTSTALYLSISIWTAEWGIKSYSTFEDASWSIRSSFESEQSSFETLQSEICPGSYLPAYIILVNLC